MIGRSDLVSLACKALPSAEAPYAPLTLVSELSGDDILEFFCFGGSLARFAARWCCRMHSTGSRGDADSSAVTKDHSNSSSSSLSFSPLTASLPPSLTLCKAQDVIIDEAPSNTKVMT